MDKWPKSWAGFESDIPLGKEIVKTMRPFLSALMREGYSRTTINRHLGNLWLLGGEIISHIQATPELKELTGAELVLRFVDEEGGPYSKHLSTREEQKSFDSTCRKLHRFLIKRPARR